MSDVTSQVRDLEQHLSDTPDDVTAARRLVELLRPLAAQSPTEYRARLEAAWSTYGASLEYRSRNLLDAELEAWKARDEGAPAGDLDDSAQRQMWTTELQWLRGIADDNHPVLLARLAQTLLSATWSANLEAEDTLLQETHHVLRRISGVANWTRQVSPGSWYQLWAEASHRLAEHCLERGDHQTALRYGRDAETAIRKADGALPDDLAAIRVTLARALSHEHASVAELREARRAIRRAANTYNWQMARSRDLKDEGGVHPLEEDYLWARYHQARILHGLGKNRSARTVYEMVAHDYLKLKVAWSGHLVEDEQYREAVTAAAAAHEALGDPATAQRIRQEHGLPSPS